jgi:hypothetical protein
MKTNKAKRLLFTILIVSAICVISNYLVRTTPVSSFAIFETVNLFTYFGVLIGFALTIYTFGLSMVSDIKSKIDNHKKLTDEQKKKMYSALLYFTRAQERFSTNDKRLTDAAFADLKKANQLAAKLNMRTDIILIYLAAKQLESGNRKGCNSALEKIIKTIPTKTPEKLIAIQAIQGLKKKVDAEVLKTLNESVQFHANGMNLLKDFIANNIQENDFLKARFKPNSKHPLHLLLKQFAKIEVRGFEGFAK